MSMAGTKYEERKRVAKEAKKRRNDERLEAHRAYERMIGPLRDQFQAACQPHYDALQERLARIERTYEEAIRR